MSDPQEFRVLRPHFGDRAYKRDDVRIAALSDVMHLVPHILQPLAEARAADPVENKDEGAAPANKRKNNAAKAAKADPVQATADAPAQADTVGPQAGEAAQATMAANQADPADEGETA